MGKATIYRWWSSRGTLALDAYLEDMRSKVAVPDTGDGFEDLRRHAEAVIRFYTGSEGRIFAAFMAEAQSDEHLAEEFRTRFLKHRRAAVNSIFQRGVARGEFRDDVDPDVAMDLIFAPIVYRLLAGHAPLSKALATELVDAALRGLSKRPGSFTPSKPSQPGVRSEAPAPGEPPLKRNRTHRLHDEIVIRHPSGSGTNGPGGYDEPDGDLTPRVMVHPDRMARSCKPTRTTASTFDGNAATSHIAWIAHL